MDGIDLIQGIKGEDKELIRRKIDEIKNEYGVHVRLVKVTGNILCIKTTFGRLNSDKFVIKPLVFNLAREPFNLKSIRENYKMTVVLECS